MPAVLQQDPGGHPPPPARGRVSPSPAFRDRARHPGLLPKAAGPIWPWQAASPCSPFPAPALKEAPTGSLTTGHLVGEQGLQGGECSAQAIPGGFSLPGGLKAHTGLGGVSAKSLHDTPSEGAQHQPQVPRQVRRTA